MNSEQEKIFFIKENFYYLIWCSSKKVTSNKKYVVVLSIGVSAMTEMFRVCTVHICTASTGNVTCVTEFLNVKFYLVLINLNSNMWLVAVVWDSPSIAYWRCLNILMRNKMWSFPGWGVGGSEGAPIDP